MDSIALSMFFYVRPRITVLFIPDAGVLYQSSDPSLEDIVGEESIHRFVLQPVALALTPAISFRSIIF